MKKFFLMTMVIGIFSIAFGAVLANEWTEEIMEKCTVFENSDFEQKFAETEMNLCNEIIEYLERQGYVIDYDSVDINNIGQVEYVAYDKLGDYYYTWRRNWSKYAPDYDALIYRYCY